MSRICFSNEIGCRVAPDKKPFHHLANRLGGCTIVVLFEVKMKISI
jgi:hypothetical protein